MVKTPHNHLPNLSIDITLCKLTCPNEKKVKEHNNHKDDNHTAVSQSNQREPTCQNKRMEHYTLYSHIKETTLSLFTELKEMKMEISISKGIQEAALIEFKKKRMTHMQVRLT